MKCENPYKDLKRQIPYKSQILSYEEAMALVKNKNILLNGNSVITSKEISWEFAKFVYESYSTHEKYLIRKSGQHLKQGYYNPNTGKLDSPNTPPTPERGIMIVQMYLQQEAMCAYTGLGPNHILDFQIEHKDPEGGDYPENITLVRANVNENRKKSTMEEFIVRHERELKKGKDSYDAKYKAKAEANKNSKKRKASILGMSEEELADAWSTNKILSKDEKYIWRNINMSSLSKFRVNKTTGAKRAGGSQGNYKPILNTIAREYLYGSKELARNIFDECCVLRNEYLDQIISLHEYAKKSVDISSHSEFFDDNKEKMIDKIVKSNYNYHDV